MANYKITKLHTIAGDAVDIIMWLFLSLIVAGGIFAHGRDTTNGILLVSFICAYLVIIVAIIARYIFVSRLISNRVGTFLHISEKNNYQHQYTEDMIVGSFIPRNFVDTSLMQIHNARSPRFSNHVIGPDWEYCDYRYSIYRQTKNGEYEAVWVYYSIMATKLPRPLPNVFFDSHEARKRQFRFSFSHEQIHSLEGGFDDYFTTYFPDGYTIDSMSFIGPDVMEALVDACNYDVEIINDELYLYGPLVNPDIQIKDMSAKIRNIKNKLMTEIEAYRDERLPGNLGRHLIAPSGQALKHSKLWRNVSIAMFIIYFLIYFASLSH